MKFMLAVALLFAATAQAADTLEIFGRSWSVPMLSDWKVESGALHLVTARGPLPGPRRPIQFALTDLPAYRQLDLEADVMALGHSLLIVFAYRDEAHFDYAHLSADTASAQPMHNGIFHVYGGERVRISPTDGPAALPHSGAWTHVRLSHIVSTGSISVIANGQEIPALHAVDLSLGAGKVGLGSFDETGAFKNVTITAER
jgi:hypothetical protein